MSTHQGRVLFWKLSADKLPVSNDCRLKCIFSNDSYEICWVYVTIIMWPHTVRILISNWPWMWKFSQFCKHLYRWRRPFLTMIMHWSCSKSNFYALIGQNLTGEFMRKIYAASWKLFTLTAEADRVLCQLEMFVTDFSSGAKWNTAAIKSLLLFMASLFIGFLVEKCVACPNLGIQFRMATFSFFTLPSLIALRNWISNGKPE